MTKLVQRETIVLLFILVFGVNGWAAGGIAWKKAATLRYQGSGLFVDVVSVPLKARVATDLRISVSYYCSAKLLKMDLVHQVEEQAEELIPYFQIGSMIEGPYQHYYYELGTGEDGVTYQIDQIRTVAQSYGYGCEVMIHTAKRP